MRIKLVSHASVIISSGRTKIWTDPWLRGRAFNESWALRPEPAWNDEWLAGIDHLWISHEHPDHFHIPTLKALPADFKRAVTVLFQRNNSDKMFEAFRRLGFEKFVALPHRKKHQLAEGLELYCYQEGLMNSCLAVTDGSGTVLNVNDAEIRSTDCRIIRRDLGKIDVVLNQFSIAGYSGLEDRATRLRKLASDILQNVADNHRDLGARTTIPFASFVYFCTTDNRYVNDYANRIQDVVDYCHPRGVDVSVLYPGDEYDLERPYDSGPALSRFDALDAAGAAPLEFLEPSPVAFDQLVSAFVELHARLVERFPAGILRLLNPVTIEVPDLAMCIEMNIRDGVFRRTEASGSADLVLHAQPLYFALKFPYGVQTLGVSARLTLRHGASNWARHRMLFALNNAEVYLQPRHLFSRRNMEFIAERLRGSSSQLRRRLETMM